jgi:hypothetical protein
MRDKDQILLEEAYKKICEAGVLQGINQGVGGVAQGVGGVAQGVGGVAQGVGGLAQAGGQAAQQRVQRQGQIKDVKAGQKAQNLSNKYAQKQGAEQQQVLQIINGLDDQSKQTLQQAIASNNDIQLQQAILGLNNKQLTKYAQNPNNLQTIKQAFQ